MAFTRDANWTVNTGPVEYDTVNGQAVPVRAHASAVKGKPAWGEWQSVGGYAFCRHPSRTSEAPVAAFASHWEHGGEKQADAADITGRKV